MIWMAFGSHLSLPVGSAWPKTVSAGLCTDLPSASANVWRSIKSWSALISFWISGRTKLDSNSKRMSLARQQAKGTREDLIVLCGSSVWVGATSASGAGRGTWSAVMPPSVTLWAMGGKSLMGPLPSQFGSEAEEADLQEGERIRDLSCVSREGIHDIVGEMVMVIAFE